MTTDNNILRLFFVFLALQALILSAEDGHRLWLRASVPVGITLHIDSTMAADDGYRITGRTPSRSLSPHLQERRTEIPSLGTGSLARAGC